MAEKVQYTDAQWRELLTPNQYAVLRQKGTERPFTGKYVSETREGTYHCAACGATLFSSDTKYKSGCGWPSFWDVMDDGNVKQVEDNSHGMRRIEVLCNNCDSHLGHVFNDGPQDKTGLRYCINSVAIELDKDTVGDSTES